MWTNNTNGNSSCTHLTFPTYTEVNGTHPHSYSKSPGTHLRDERADLVLYLHEAAEATLHDGGEVEQSQRVASGGSVKDHHGEVHSFHQPGGTGGQ